MTDYMEAYGAEMHQLLTLVDRLEVMGTRHVDWAATHDAALEAERRLIVACDPLARRLIERAVRADGRVRYDLRFTVWAPHREQRFKTPACVQARLWLFGRTGRQRYTSRIWPDEPRVTLCIPWRPDGAHVAMLSALIRPAINAARSLPPVAVTP